MSLSLRQTFRSASYLFMGGIGTAFISFIQGAIVARTLGPSQYGVWGVVQAFCGLVPTFVGFRTQEPLTRYLVEYKHKQDWSSLQLLIGTALLTDLSTKLFSFVVIAVAAPWMTQKVAGGTEALLLYWLYGATVIFSFVDATWYSVARDRKQFKLLATLPSFFTAVQLGLTTILWLLSWLNLLNLGIIFLTISIIKCLLSFIYLKSYLREGYQISLRNFNWLHCFAQWRNLEGFWQFMRTTYLSSMVSTLVKNGDILILGYYRTDAEVGIYRLAKSLAGLVQSVSVALSSVIYQDFNELIVTKKFSAIKQRLARFSQIWIPTVLVSTFGAFLVVEPVIRIFYGGVFIESLTAFKILMIGNTLVMMFFWVQPMVLALNEYSYNLKLITIICGSSLITMVALVPYLGTTGLCFVVTSMWAILYLVLLIKVLKSI